MKHASALRRADDLDEKSATSISGTRTIDLPASEGRLRGIVITPEPPPLAMPSEGAITAPLAIDRFQVEFAYDTQFFADLAGDVSKGGIVITTYRDVPVGTSVHLDFELPNGTPVQVRGEVRWIREDSALARRGLAIAFTEITYGALQAISEYCAVHRPLFVDFDE
jgi:uncharacterized protein (TIGR02266 family)